jgi:fermentation-respiration switch protein FrsA (DUF1100 family)
MRWHHLMLLGLMSTGCMSLDGFFFNPLPVDEYAFDGDIPLEHIEEVSFQSGGHTLAGVWVTPPDVTGTLVYFHGNKENIDAYWDRMEAYYEMGFRTFTFDYRGYGKSEGKPTYDGVLVDGQVAIDHVEAHTGLDIGQLPLLGFSLGGCVASHTAVTRTPQVLVTEAMFANPDLLTREAAAGMSVPAGWLYENPFDNAGAVRRQDAPVLIMHGSIDDYISPAHAEEVYETAQEPKKLWLVPGANHSDIIPHATTDVEDQLKSWIAEHTE